MDYKSFSIADINNDVYCQGLEVAQSPAYKKEKIRLMCDAHRGVSGPIGFTSTFTDMIVPQTCGIDIACRVSAFSLPLFKDDCDEKFLAEFDEVVHNVIPSGFDVRQSEHELSKSFPYEELFCWNNLKNHDRLRKSMGTLGGGNHYIELDADENTGQVYLVIHSGSRNLGKQVAEYYQKKAIEQRDHYIQVIKKSTQNWIEQLREEGKIDKIQGYIEARNELIAKEPSDDLCYLLGIDLENYLKDMILCNEWSLRSHIAMYEEIIKAIELSPELTHPSITCIHNYVDVKHRMIRKGAIAGYKDQIGLIPLNMRDGILIVRAKGNEDWNCSLPHDAGRIMSRGQTKKDLTVEEYQESMDGIYSSCLNENTLDEAPMAYKNAEEIKTAIAPNADIIGHWKPIYNFKDNKGRIENTQIDNKEK